MSFNTKAEYVIEHTGSNLEVAIPTVIGNIEYVETIGRGGHGVVYRGIDRRTNQIYACKAVDRRILARESEMFSFEQEIRAHEHLNHPNIVKIYQILYHEKVIVLVMEFCGNRDLLSMMMESQGLPMTMVRRILGQILLALNYLHERGISHGDIKPENILFDAQFNVKLADFGCVQMDHNKPLVYQRGTLYYAPPEAFQSNSVVDGRPGDVWALGVVTFAMVTGKMPWKVGTPEELVAQIRTGDLHFPLDFSPDLEMLIRQCCTVSVESRATVAKLLDAKWGIWDNVPATSRVMTEPAETARPKVMKPLVLKQESGSLSPAKAVMARGIVTARRAARPVLRMRPGARRPVSRSLVSSWTLQQVV